VAGYSKAIIVGNLTRDPELSYTPNGAAVCEFALAINRKYKKSDGQAVEEVSFIDCLAWARGGEVIAEFMKKGSPLLVEGRLQQDRWTGKDGQPRSRVRVVVEQFKFLGQKRDGEDAPAAEDAAEPAGAPTDGQPPF